MVAAAATVHLGAGETKCCRIHKCPAGIRQHLVAQPAGLLCRCGACLRVSSRLAACLVIPPSACVCYAAGNMHNNVALCRLGGVYRPSVVRVGLQAHHSVEHVALDTLIDRRMSANKDAPVRSLKCK